MKNFLLAVSLLACLVHVSTSQAEDTDIYSGLGGSMGKPNVLIVFDNAANFSSNAAGSSCVIDGVATNLSGTVGGIEQCAFYNVINALPDDVVNIGMMVYNANNIRDYNNANCGGSNGGCLVVPLTTMTASTKAPLLAWIKTWVTTGGAGNGYIKSAGEATAATLQEAWAYYAGGTGLSGRSYTAIKPASGCQQNFVIFIGNSFSSSGSPGDGGTVSPANALDNAPGVSTAQKALITTSHATSCGTYSFPSSAHESKGFYADEWARYMRQHDLYSAISEIQKITTYTIGLLGSSCKAEYAATLSSMAAVGGGKYFATSDYESITQALLKILNEVQAVNSVFSSSSLPVSVNTQGTYLNQVYMGMFRPDASAYPRWVGNLKQYQFIYDAASDTLKLGDSQGIAALSSAGTGFISPNALSYWTCGDGGRACSPVADLTAGFWAQNPQGAGGAHDLPDGELVEKGGAAQIMRLANLSDDYTTLAGTTTNPRKLYTYCPGGSACNAALSHSANAFATGNSDITAAMFGASSSLNVSSLVRSGTTALVTTSGAHGYSDGASVTISGANQTEYNLTQAITVNSATTFTLTGLPDRPTTPSAGAYTVSLHNSAAQTISSLSRSSSSTATARNSETATASTAAAHGYSTGNSVQITGATPSDYNGVKTITVTGASQFTYPVSIYPTTPAANSYKAVIHPYSRMLSSITKSAGTGTATTAAAHGFHVGQIVTLAGTGQTEYNGNKTIATVPSTTTFTFTGLTGHPGAITAGATVTPSTTAVVLGTLTRTGTTSAATATATGVAASAFANGDTLDITLNSGAAANESAYLASGALISCSTTCTSFTYTIAATPATGATGTLQVALSGSPVSLPAGSMVRSGATVTVAGVANSFVSGNTVDISTSGVSFANESAYTGVWPISCPFSCSTAFSFGPVAISPATPATGAHITAYQGSTPPAKDPLINWVRGQDNFGDEQGPGGGVTVRPSLHGDVLHSRPVVINYGGSTGVIVYYGANDGVYRAVNGNQANPAGSALPVPGSELWGFIPTEFFGKLERQRTNSPQLLLPSTPAGILPAPLRKDYFADGSTGVYQLLNADGTTGTAHIYLAMRRGGRLLYALDVSNPVNPQFLWKIDPAGLTTPAGLSASSDFAELGQTWSAPKVAQVEGYANPVLIFGAGYDTAEDSEPPTAGSMGRGIYIVDALSGALVWSAAPQLSGASACGGTATRAACLVSGMNYSIPADITLVDRDGNGKIDRLYAVDVGGNVWRVDLQPSSAHQTPEYWQVNKLAALGCATGPCASGVTPRKFFYPVDVVFTPTFDAVMAGQGDREHPLFRDASVTIRNRVFMLKDMHTGFDGSGSTAIIRSELYDATSTNYDGSLKGYYIRLGNAEKVVNAPLTVAGYTYFGTNQPVDPDANSCSVNLGVARGYKLAPLSASYTHTNYAGGGLPPSSVAGLVNITVTVNGVESSRLVPFLIGGGGDPNCADADCMSALGGNKPTINVPTSRNRTYWYQEMD